MAKNYSANESMRKRLWPTIDENLLWMSNKRVGFTQVPRGLSLVNRILDSLSPGKPLAHTYLALWCRLFDNGVIKIESQSSCAFESGFSGPRALTTWKSRIRILSELGFIKTAEGASGEFSYVLMLDPYKQIMALKEAGQLGHVTPEYNSLLERIQKADPNFLEAPRGFASAAPFASAVELR